MNQGVLTIIGDICKKDSWVRLECESCGTVRLRQIKCNLTEINQNNCIHCSNLRKRKIIAKAMDRFNRLKRYDSILKLWTFGTNLPDTPDNRKSIRLMWKNFLKHLRKYKPRIFARWKPWMNCLESGSKGDRLHYHVICEGWVHQAELLPIWREFAQNNSHVFVRGSSSSRKAVKSFSYLAKYAAKGFGYYWMGDLLKIKETPFEYEPEHTWDFSIFSWGFRLQRQQSIDDFIT